MSLRRTTLILGALLSLTACTAPAAKSQTQGETPLPTITPNTQEAAPKRVSERAEISRSSRGFAERPDVRQFILTTSQKQNLDPEWLTEVMDRVEIKPKIIEAMNRPAEGKIWGEYRPIFMTERRINDGIRFYQEHQSALERAERTYGVSAEVIAAIIGVETSYGQNRGSWAVIDALATLAFEYPRRAQFFTGELEKFLTIVDETNFDPFSYKGSYAGAMGYPQFMPSSYLAYAVDFDGDGVRDLWNNPIDAIGSVGNYLAKHRWQAGEPVAVKVEIDPTLAAPYIAKGRLTPPKYSAATLRANGVMLPASIPNHLKGNLYQYQLSKEPARYEYWVGFENFYSITRYNHSQMYALAVYQLADAIKRGR